MKNLTRLITRLEKTIPLLVMGALALTSFVVLKASPTHNAPAHVPSQAAFDYSLHNFSSAQLNISGELVSLIKGQKAVHSTLQRATLIDDMTFTSHQAQAHYSGYAKQATVNDDNNAFTLLGNAAITRIARNTAADEQTANHHLKMTGEHFHISQYPERLTAQLPVYVEQGNRTVWADSLRYDGDEQQLSFQGNVKIKVVPNKSQFKN